MSAVSIENPEKTDQFGRGVSTEPDNEEILDNSKFTQPVDSNILAPKPHIEELIYRKPQYDLTKSPESFDIIELPNSRSFKEGEGPLDENPTDATGILTIVSSLYRTLIDNLF